MNICIAIDVHCIFVFSAIRFDTEWKSRGCSNKFLVTHKQTKADMKIKWNRLRKDGQICEGAETKVGKVFNLPKLSSSLSLNVSLSLRDRDRADTIITLHHQKLLRKSPLYSIHFLTLLYIYE